VLGLSLSININIIRQPLKPASNALIDKVFGNQTIIVWKKIIAEDSATQSKEREETSERVADAMEMCPMASMCKGMMAKSGSGFLLMIPGAALVLGGLLILLEPKVLFWLMAGTSILIGIIMLVLANFIRKMGARLRNVHG
jgi:hypothetical protein